jgi:hypothetical protein
MGLFKSPIDKYLFVMFRDRQLTLDQLKSRLAEKHQGVCYQVLDDLRDVIEPSILSKCEGPNSREQAFKIY